MIGKTISHYKILEKLGEGGMGVVYKAEDIKLKRTVALKFITSKTAWNGEEKIRFMREAQAAAALSHPNISIIYEIDEAEGKSFISMEYIDGQSVKEKIRTGPLKLDEALEIAIQAAEGLEEAHKKGVIHRDIKSANIMVTGRNRAKIMDFGLAKLVGGTMLTEPETIMGTVSYMSPEQAMGEPVDQRSDIWALGVVLYEMLTGELPFKGEHGQVVLYSILRRKPKPITRLRKGLPIQLETIIDKCLEKNIKKRYQNTSDIKADLRSLKGSLNSGMATVHISPAAVLRPFPKLLRKAAIPAAVVILGLFAVLLGLNVGGLKDHLIGRTPPILIKSVAVLPLKNLSGDPEQEYFADGMTEEIIGKLSKLEELKVICRTSAMRYKNTDKDIKQIGRELGVASILEASVRKENDNIRVSAFLINVEDGFPLWSHSYNQELKSVFKVQDEISMAIAKALKVKLLPDAFDAYKAKEPEDVEAYEYYLKGLHNIEAKYSITNKKEDFKLAIEMYQKAIEIDPNYALAYCGLGMAYEAHYVITKDKKDFNLMLMNFEKAYQLNPNLAETNVALGWAYFYNENLEKAFKSFQKALEIDPNKSMINFYIGSFYYSIGLYKKSIVYYSKSIEHDPVYIWPIILSARNYMFIGDFKNALAFIKKGSEIEPDNLLLHLEYSRYYIWHEKYEDAERILSKAQRIKPNDSEVKLYQAWVFAAKGENQKALELIKDEAPYHYEVTSIYSLLGMQNEAIGYINEGIKNSLRNEMTYYYSYPFLINNPCYDNLRDDTRFQVILKKEEAKYKEKLEKYSN